MPGEIIVSHETAEDAHGMAAAAISGKGKMKIVADSAAEPLLVESLLCVEAWKQGEPYTLNVQKHKTVEVRLGSDDVIELFEALLERELRSATLAKMLEVCTEGVSRLPIVIGSLDLLNRSVEDLELSLRCHKSLKNAGIETAGELTQKTEAELRSIKGLGRNSLGEIKRALATMGLALRKPPWARKSG